jgi:hypothetical protein
MNTSQRIRPSAIHLMGAGIVLVSCEIGMSAVWAFLAFALLDAPEILAKALPVSLAINALLVYVAWLEYRATFLQNADAASAITRLLVFATILISVPFFDLTSMLLGIKDSRLDVGWYILLTILLITLFAATTNWSWSNQLQASKAMAIQPIWRWSLATMLCATTVLGVQFGIANVLIRYWRG